MAKNSAKQNDPNTVIADGEVLDLRNRGLAAVLAWLIPGAGHAYQRRYLKSVIFSVSIFFCFITGMVFSNYKCVYASWDSTETRWQYFLQAGVGIPALPAAYQWWKNKPGAPTIFGDWMAAPERTSVLDDWHRDTASGFDMGTLYTMIAGLLNILVVYDAFAGPLPPPETRQKKKDDDNGAEKSKAPAG